MSGVGLPRRASPQDPQQQTVSLQRRRCLLSQALRSGENVQMSAPAGNGNTILRQLTYPSTLPSLFVGRILATAELAVAWIWRAVVLIGLAAVTTAIGSMQACAQSVNDTNALLKQSKQLYLAGQFAQAAEMTATARDLLGLVVLSIFPSSQPEAVLMAPSRFWASKRR